MARVSYVDESSHPELAALIGEIREERRGRLIPVYGLLLHSPDVARAWLALINAVRWRTRLDARVRELVILRVAALNDAAYVIDVHRRHFTGADGLGAAECDALCRAQVPPGVFEEADAAVIAYVDESTRGAKVSPEVFRRVRGFLDERQVVELSVLIGAYNMHTRVINALEIDPE
ncbi:carboxymuconolactone decarboxylase family protein [Pigmentiphaga sp.]|uniref:carboxymuconolactone decarboxylase family protein n=1 Tax=Pigmentiphaga sp. TaxID=1977564 RepID=UPI00128B5B44|nr:carboxymuconolactone decarboxylase family protein [Pigmentiphaga sp.]MPS27264.1 carboxymuconolactone decarboxylase family protein [Alcaligenaceae bacterium SAGV5]MPS51592.1 carboxymuconolactone decarboxylase family protein [Alcaligenaceae bacterium SAGV3]MPT58988.1 carboxymuconolactone decarboxylase family protein [Alcaligenaceae bacterium]